MVSAEPIAIELKPGEDSDVLRLTWSGEPLESGGDTDTGHSTVSPWQIDGEIDWEHAEAVRLVSATFEDGQALALVAVRQRGAAGHGNDSVASYLTVHDEPVPIAEALLSTEYDAEGLPRRVGVELIVDPAATPLRVAGDREGPVEIGGEGEGVRREAARMSFRLQGATGTGLYEVLRPT
jgi:hypothetical protein